MRSKFHLVLAATLALGFLGLAHDEFVAFAMQNTAHSQDIIAFSLSSPFQSRRTESERV